MSWAKISAIITVAGFIIGGTWWFSENIVLASDFNQYQTEQQVKWLQYDKRSAWQEYISLRQLRNRTANEARRMLELERAIKDLDTEIGALRLHQ